MKITGRNGLGSQLKCFLQMCFWGGITFLIALPIVLQKFGFTLNASAYIIYPNGIVLLIITHKFMKLFDSLKKNQPFCERNVKILRMTGVVALIGSIFWLMDLLYEVILAKSADLVVIVTLVFLSILFLSVAIALYMLSELLKEATEYKKENELTI